MLRVALSCSVFLTYREQGGDPHIISVEKLWKDNSGELWLFGCWFYRPKETFHVATKKFLDQVQVLIKVFLYYYVTLDVKCYGIQHKCFNSRSANNFCLQICCLFPLSTTGSFLFDCRIIAFCRRCLRRICMTVYLCPR